MSKPHDWWAVRAIATLAIGFGFAAFLVHRGHTEFAAWVVVGTFLSLPWSS